MLPKAPRYLTLSARRMILTLIFISTALLVLIHPKSAHAAVTYCSEFPSSNYPLTSFSTYDGKKDRSYPDAPPRTGE